MGKLKDLLVGSRPRETSGSRSANRFEFQKSWALCRLLELHRAGKDYLIVFDFHDDVLVLNSACDPTRIDFYQIKTKQSGHWTCSDLLARKKGKKGLLPSILGKMLGNKLAFPDHAGTLNFVSTQGFKLSVKGKAGSVVQEVCLKQLTDKELNTIVAALREEHSLSADPQCADCTHLTVTSLSLGDHGTHAMGVLGAFLAEHYPGEKVHLPAIYRTLCDEIKRKTNVERQPVTFSELCAERSISRDRFIQFLADVKPATEFDGALREAVSTLQAERMPFDEVRRIREACSLYEVERMDGTNLVLRKARDNITRFIAKVRKDGNMPARLGDAIVFVADGLGEQLSVVTSVKSTQYRSAMILMALYGF
jgi:hypothetical protein